MYKYAAAGYLVKEGKVLLVHHNRLDKWVPPGGHLKEGEAPHEAAEREFFEETGLKVVCTSAYPPAFVGDANALPSPLPFHIDVERDGFDVPRLIFFYFVESLEGTAKLKHQESEIFGIGWFSREDLPNLPTFDQVKALARFALDNYPNRAY